MAVQVGGFTIFRNEDLGQVLPLWIKYTEDVREDPDVRPPHSSAPHRVACMLARAALERPSSLR